MKKIAALIIFAIIVFYVWTIPLDTLLPGVETYNQIGQQMENIRYNPIMQFLGIISLFIILKMIYTFASKFGK